MSRTISIEELNKRIDELIKEYEQEIKDFKRDDGEKFFQGKIEALTDLKLELNSPDAVVNVTENVQQTLNVIEANKIINDNPDKDEL